jgi:transcription elongation GreA/GreB family factor
LEVIGAFFSALDDAPGAAPQMRAGLGARVTIRRGVLLSKVIIVAEDEADPARGRIASTAPLGCALEGARRGDVIELEAGGRTEQVHVFAVERGEG